MGVLRGLVGLAKASIGKSGRLKASEKAAITKAAKLNDMSPTEFRKAAKIELKTPTAAPATTKKKTYPSLESLGKGKAKPTPTAKDQGSTKGLTRRQKAQRKNLIERSKADERKAKLQREGVVLKGEEPDRIKLTAGGTEVLPSKEQIDPKIRNYSKRRIRELIKTGQAKMVVDKKGKRSIKTTGKFASPQEMVAEEMGLGSRGSLPTSKEARALGLTVKKEGGVVKYRKNSKKIGGGKKKPKAKKIDPWLKGKGREEGWWLSSDREKGGPVIKRKKPGPVKIKVLKPGPKPKEEKWGKRYGHRKGQSAFGKKSGGAIKRNRGGAVRGVGKANRGFGNAQYSKKLY